MIIPGIDPMSSITASRRYKERHSFSNKNIALVTITKPTNAVASFIPNAKVKGGIATRAAPNPNDP